VAPEEGLEVVSAVVPHQHSFGRNRALNEGFGG
jgi:hypothetical protein